MLILRNPRARTVPAERELSEAAAPLRRAGWDIELRNTRHAGDAIDLAREAAASGASTVVACGGDGTVREVVTGLAGSETALGVIRGGTANVWAREAFIPRGARAALGALVRARRVRVDTGTVATAEGEHGHFLLMCSAGIDAEVLRAVESGRLKGPLGRAAFAGPAARALMSAPPVHARLTLDGNALERDLLTAVIANTQLYASFMRPASVARIDDGLLDVCAFSSVRGRRLERARLAWHAVRGVRPGPGHQTGVDYVVGSTVELDGERPIAVQADGEYLGTTPARIEVVPASLTVLMGRRPNRLLGEDTRTR